LTFIDPYDKVIDVNMTRKRKRAQEGPARVADRCSGAGSCPRTSAAADKGVVLREAARVLRRGGRLAVTDIIAGTDLDEATRADMEQWAGCLAGALTEAEYRAALGDAGFVEVEVIEAHRSDERAFAAIVKAGNPRSPRDDRGARPDRRYQGW
jgi:hypothetical protein